jgi:pyruvate dehydrogenase E2 component (dihydrolipoamide acetyltransferase)
VAYEFKLPDLGEGLTEGEIARWFVAEGQELAEDDPLVEIATDKTTVEIPSPAAGTVTKILVPEGEVVAVGTVIVVIGGDGAEPGSAEQPRADPAETAPAPAPERASVYQTQTRVQATPLVRRLAQELGVDLAQLSGSGSNGRIVEADVRGAAGTELVSDRHKLLERGEAALELGDLLRAGSLLRAEEPRRVEQRRRHVASHARRDR